MNGKKSGVFGESKPDAVAKAKRLSEQATASTLQNKNHPGTPEGYPRGCNVKQGPHHGK